jgi:hypothetical protein
MNYKIKLMTGLIGLALLAAPISAAAKDNDSGRNDSHQARSESRHDSSPSHDSSARPNDHGRSAAPASAARNESRDQRAVRTETRNPASEPVTRNESRDRRDVRPAPAVADHRDSREVRSDGDRWNRDGDRDYRSYGDRYHGDYDGYAEGAPYYVMPRGYAGGACGWARHLRNVYNQDRYTGHPAAAEDLLPQLYRAERACGGVPYGYNGYRYLW